MANSEPDAAAAPEDTMQPRNVAAAVLRPMLELEAKAAQTGAPLPPGHAALRARALGLLAAIGRAPATWALFVVAHRAM